MKQGLLVIYQSADCETWEPVKAVDVPEWVKAPDVVAHMVDGEAVRDESAGGAWYIAKRVLSAEDESALMKAYLKRERRQRIRLLHEQPQGESRVVH